ncbi:MAG: hydroxyisourate hydrolase [Candidatus Promineifilaceae bacterium]
MAIVSSHVLDSVSGDHAKGIRIACFALTGATRELLFDVIADQQGRIAEEVVLISAETQHELVFHTADYFAAQSNAPTARQTINEVVVRFTIDEPNGRTHIPMMLSPHSYSIWWSA